MTTSERDYSLLGESGRRAVDTGLASAEWYHSDVPRKTMKELMKRTDGPAIRDTIIWLGSWSSSPLQPLSSGRAVVGSIFSRLRRAVRLSVGFALARMWPRYRVQDPLDE